MERRSTPDWLRERVNDGYGTDNKHPFWKSVSVELIGVWKVFERDGIFYGYKTTQNAWATFKDHDDAVKTATGRQVDIWA